jgi:hypothetical protein
MGLNRPKVRHRRHQIASIFLKYYSVNTYADVFERRLLPVFVTGRHGSSPVVIGAERRLLFTIVDFVRGAAEARRQVPGTCRWLHA